MASSRVWLITGTSSGFGHRLVDIVCARGDRVIATARSLSKITHFLDGPDGKRSNVHCAELDISAGTEQVKERIDTIIRESGWGSVDVLANNAGVGMGAFVEEGGAKFLREQFQSNVFGTLDVTTAVLPYMRKQKSGTVVMVGSRSAWRTEIQGAGHYGSSKAALHAISETLAIELESFGIRVLIVEPGSFRTEVYRNVGLDASNLIPDYLEKREAITKAFTAPSVIQQGDPAKAMKAVVEVVYGEGRAQGRPWPLYLVLGKDAERDVRKKCGRMISHLDEWGDVVRDVDLDEVN